MNNEMKSERSGTEGTNNLDQEIKIDSASYYPKPYKKMNRYGSEQSRSQNPINVKKWLVSGCLILFVWYYFLE